MLNIFFYFITSVKMSAQPRRSTRTRKAPQRFSDESFATKKTSESTQINSDEEVTSQNSQGVDGQEYYEEYDGQGRLWEINLVTGEGTLLYDPSQFSEDTVESGQKETKEPDTTITQYLLIFKLRSKQLARKLYQPPVQITENHTLFSRWLPTSGVKNPMESPGNNIIYYLNKAVNPYTREDFNKDTLKLFKDKNLFVLDEITIRESYFTPEGEECGEPRTFYPEWGRKHNLTPYGALVFDGATFHFYSDRVDNEGPQLVITEKEKPRDKRVTFNLPPKKRKPLDGKEKGEEVFKKAVETPLPQETDIKAAETLLSISNPEKKSDESRCPFSASQLWKQKQRWLRKREEKAQKKKTDKKKLKKRVDKLFSPTGYSSDYGEHSGSHLYRQTYQKFNVFSDEPVSAEQQLFTNSLVSPLTTLAHLWTSTNFQLYCDEYMVFKYTNLSNGTSNVSAFIYTDRYTHQKNIILYNNQTEYYMDNFRKKLWWEYGHQLDYSIKIVHNIEQEIAQSLKHILKQNS